VPSCKAAIYSRIPYHCSKAIPLPRFKAIIQIIGINPYVLLPEKALLAVFKQARTDKGKIRVAMTIDGHPFSQTLVKYAGEWRLYLNMPMRKAAGKDVGDTAAFTVSFDKDDKPEIPMHPKLVQALHEHPGAKDVFDKLPPSRAHEIVRYISRLKSEETIDRNVARAIGFLMGNERFIGRDKPL
jgi:hypothetical protein